MSFNIYRQSVCGFTLVELLVAISILTFIAVLGWRGLDTIIRTRSSLDQELEQTHNLQIIFAQIQNDGANIVNASMIDGRSPLVITRNRFGLVRTVSAETTPTKLQWVSYRLQENVLYRETSPATRDLQELQAYWQQLNSDDDVNIARVHLQADIRELTVRVWANDGRGWLGQEDMNTLANAVVSRGSLMNPQIGSTVSGMTWRGLQITLNLLGSQGGLSKTILLGAT